MLFLYFVVAVLSFKKNLKNYKPSRILNTLKTRGMKGNKILRAMGGKTLQSSSFFNTSTVK
jgi:hypothetical protein